MTGIWTKIWEWVDRIFTWPVMVYRKWKYGYTFRRIYLGEGEYTIVDQNDYYKYGGIRWSLGGDKKKYYAVAGIKDVNGELIIQRLHRLIANAPKGILVDHHNGKSLDNRSENLRLATRAQNNCNKSKQKNASSKYMGAHFHKLHKKWIAQLSHNNKHIFLGYFDNEIDAAKAYDAAAKKYHRIFARLNFPDISAVSPLEKSA
ncbi:MAG: HNH endonuclease [Sedimentisphaerales bacterium]